MNSDDPRVIYVCSVCRAEHASEAGALACAARPIEDNGWRPGDWVLCPGKWQGWAFDLAWVAHAEPGRETGDQLDRCMHLFAWYVVSAVKHRSGSHQCDIHLTTGAFSENGGVYTGYTIPWRRHEGRAQEHYAIYRPTEIGHSYFADWFPSEGLPDAPSDARVLEVAAEAVRRGLTGELL